MLYTDIDARQLLVAERHAQLVHDASSLGRSDGDAAGRRRFTPDAVRSRLGRSPLQRVTQIIAVVVPFAVAAILALPAAATQPQAVQLVLNGHITGPSSIAGTWSATGAVTDSGTYTETFHFVGNTVHVEKVLVGSGGTIDLAARATVVWTSPCTATFAAGNWEMSGVSGAYTSLRGGGSPAATATSFGDVCTGAIRITHVGSAHFDGASTE
jgi:hypothetical protein